MSLNIISNFAANVAHRNLVNSDRAATSSLAKLASGKRVVSAKDDAASLAIGSRLRAEVQGLKQAQVNAGQAVSMLQIADGAMARIDDILVRMKTLALQSTSGQLSDTERTILNTEYSQLLDEVSRITDDTEFNGTQLLKGGAGFSLDGVAGSTIAVVDGYESFTFSNSTLLADGDTVQVAYNATTDQFTITVTGGTGGTYTSSTGISSPDAGEFLDVQIAEIGLTIKLNSLFDDTSAIVAGANSDFTIQTIAGGDTLSLTFKVGTGTEAQDDIVISVSSTTTANLDSNLATSAINTSALAAVALTAVGNAIDTLASNRAGVGAAQNTLEFASANIATAVENAEAARSQLLDLDVAQEMSVFTSKQILVQTGIAMLAQANQLPQNLLRLFQ